jgi:sporulation protein YabP
MMDVSRELNHDVILKSRKKLEMTGINDVASYDDGEIVVQTDSSSLSIEGEGLKIERFDSEKGELVVNGTINSIFYFGKENKKKKALSK